MDLLALLRKEALSVRANAALFVVLLILLPAALVAGTLVYEQTIPRDVPVGVVGEDDATEQDLAVVDASVVAFASPERYDDRDAAEAALLREEVYVVIRVPGELANPEADATLTVVSDSAFVPFQEPVNESSEVLADGANASVPANVSVEHERLGEERSLSEYLVPPGLLAFVVLFGLVYLPYQVRSERLVLDRLRTSASLDVVVASKLLFYGAALAVPAAVVGLTTTWLGYDVAALSPATLAVLGLSFAFLAATGLAVLFALGLSRSALVANLGLALGAVALSSFLFPVGFFSSTQVTIARALPTHYAVVAARSAMLRDVPVSLYADYLLYLLAATVVALLALKLAMVRYERRA